MTVLHRAFIPDARYEIEGFPVRHVFGNKATSGEIGIEIECEGNKMKKEYLPAPWRYEHDGSLRGVDNAEYIFQQPMKFSDVPKAISDLWSMFDDYGTVLDESNRTSVHVHLNVQNFFLNRLCSFFGLYVAVEEILTAWAGDHRVGNLFCLRAKDAPNIITRMKQFLRTDGRGHDISQGLHYSGLNIHAMIKYGSLEVRSLRGCTDPKMILDWVSVLERIYKLSGDFEDPRTITDNFSGGGPIEFLRMVLGDKYDVVRAGIDMTESEVRAALWDGLRMAQDLCYCRDWERYKPTDVSKNPFGRNGRKTSGSISDILAEAAPVGFTDSFGNTVGYASLAGVWETGSTLQFQSQPLVSPAPVPVSHEEPDMEGWSDDQIDAYYDAQEANSEDDF